MGFFRALIYEARSNEMVFIIKFYCHYIGNFLVNINSEQENSYKTMSIPANDCSIFAGKNLYGISPYPSFLKPLMPYLKMQNLYHPGRLS